MSVVRSFVQIQIGDSSNLEVHLSALHFTGLCSGEWLTNITMYDSLRVPAHLEAGEYVLGFRWDCESSAQVWQSCADITITK